MDIVFDRETGELQPVSAQEPVAPQSTELTPLPEFEDGVRPLETGDMLNELAIPDPDMEHAPLSGPMTEELDEDELLEVDDLVELDDEFPITDQKTPTSMPPPLPPEVVAQMAMDGAKASTPPDAPEPPDGQAESDSPDGGDDPDKKGGIFSRFFGKK